MIENPSLSFRILALLLTAFLVAASSEGAARKETPSDLGHFIEAHLSQWDTDHDGSLDLAEINRHIESRSVRGREAAVMVAIYRGPLNKGRQLRVKRADLLAAAERRSFQAGVAADSRRLGKVTDEDFDKAAGRDAESDAQPTQQPTGDSGKPKQETTQARAGHGLVL